MGEIIIIGIIGAAIMLNALILKWFVGLFE